jgi:hypothetical protein
VSNQNSPFYHYLSYIPCLLSKYVLFSEDHSKQESVTIYSGSDK